MKRDSFVFYKSFYDAIKELKNPEERSNFFTAICEYAIEGNEIELTGISKALFILVKPQLDANNRKYENGKRGGRPPKDVETY